MNPSELLLAQLIKQVKKRLNKNRLVQPNGCWFYNGMITSEGYHKMNFNHRQWYLHRLVFFIFKPEEFTESAKILHKCNNRRCWNPDHLYNGTKADNARDAINAGTHVSVLQAAKTHCPNGHEYTNENTYRQPSRPMVRRCKKCIRIKHQMESLSRVFNEMAMPIS